MYFLIKNDVAEDFSPFEVMLWTFYVLLKCVPKENESVLVNVAVLYPAGGKLYPKPKMNKYTDMYVCIYIYIYILWGKW